MVDMTSPSQQQPHEDAPPTNSAYNRNSAEVTPTLSTDSASSTDSDTESASGNYHKNMRKINLALTGFSCSSCVSKLVSVLQPLSPELTVSADLASSTAVVCAPRSVSETAIANALLSLPSGKTAQIITSALSKESCDIVDRIAASFTNTPVSQPAPQRLRDLLQREGPSPSTQTVRRFRCGCSRTNCTCSPVRILPNDPGTNVSISSTSRALVPTGSDCCCSPDTCLPRAQVDKVADQHETAIDMGDADGNPILDGSQFKTVSLTVSGMTCAACVSTVRQILEKVPHVQKAYVSLLASRAELAVNPSSFDPTDAIAALATAGFDATSLATDSTANKDCLLHLRFPSVSDARLAMDLLQESPSVDSISLLRRSDLPRGIKYESGGFSKSLRTFLGLTKEEREDCLPIVRLESRSKLDDFTKLRDHGFDPTIISSSDSLITGKLDASTLLKQEARHSLHMFLGSLLFTLPIVIISMILVRIPAAGGDQLKTRIGLSAFTVADTASFVLATPVQFIFGFRFYRGAWFALKKRRANMDVLIALGTTVAYAFGVVVLSMNTIQIRRGLGITEEGSAFETSSLLITIVLFGKWLETIAKKRTVAGIEALSKLAPRNVAIVSPPPSSSNLFKDPVDVQLASVGDYFRVNAGAAFPLDGEVAAGETVVDESMLTGESWPVPKTIGDAVYAGSVNGHGAVVVRCTATGSDSMVDKIASLVERAQMSRAPVEAFADRVMAYFVPTVLVCALLTTVVWFSLAQSRAIPASWSEGEGNVMFALLFGLSVLVIACPCALGLATPTVVMVATSVAARKAGILYKDGGEALQAAQRIKRCLFDKTGTLTVGKPLVSVACSVHITTDAELDFVGTKEGKFEKRTLAAVAAVESMSDHPLARAVVAFAEQNQVTVSDLQVSEHENHSGHGLSAVIDNEHKVFVGKAEWVLEEVGLSGLTKRLSERLDSWEESGKTIILAHATGIGSLMLGVEDAPKKDSLAVVLRLKAMGIRCGMVTGDALKTAKYVAAAVGIDESEIHARAMPDDKVRVVESEMQATNGAVAFVGDGVNDAAALTAASVGIAMGTGSDVATESASIALVGDNIWDVVTTVDLSRKAMGRIKLNYIWALGFNCIGVPLAAGALFPLLHTRIPPFAAAAAMALSSVSVVACSLTLTGYKRPVA